MKCRLRRFLLALLRQALSNMVLVRKPFFFRHVYGCHKDLRKCEIRYVIINKVIRHCLDYGKKKERRTVMAEPKKDYLSSLASEIEKKPDSFKEEKVERIVKPKRSVDPKIMIGAAAALIIAIIGVYSCFLPRRSRLRTSSARRPTTLESGRRKTASTPRISS